MSNMSNTNMSNMSNINMSNMYNTNIFNMSNQGQALQQPSVGSNPASSTQKPKVKKTPKTCSVCGTTFPEIGELTRHLQLRHNVVEFPDDYHPCRDVDPKTGYRCDSLIKNSDAVNGRAEGRVGRERSHRHVFSDVERRRRIKQPTTNKEMARIFQLRKWKKYAEEDEEGYGPRKKTKSPAKFQSKIDSELKRRSSEDAARRSVGGMNTAMHSGSVNPSPPTAQQGGPWDMPLLSPGGRLPDMLWDPELLAAGGSQCASLPLSRTESWPSQRHPPPPPPHLRPSPPLPSQFVFGAGAAPGMPNGMFNLESIPAWSPGMGDINAYAPQGEFTPSPPNLFAPTAPSGVAPFLPQPPYNYEPGVFDYQPSCANAEASGPMIGTDNRESAVIEDLPAELHQSFDEFLTRMPAAESAEDTGVAWMEAEWEEYFKSDQLDH